MIRALLTASLAAALMIAPSLAADTTKAIKFKKGATSATVSSKVTGYDSTNFTLGAKKGQTMLVTFTPSNASCYFNLWPPGVTPGTGTALFDGSSGGNSTSLKLPQDGTYLVQTYLMRNEARRGTSCTFELTVSIN